VTVHAPFASRSPAGDEADREAGTARPTATALARVTQANSFWIFLVLLGLVIAFSAAAPSTFATSSNAGNIATNAGVYLLLAAGETFVIITAGIDLSIGSVLVLAGVCSAKVMYEWGGTSADLGQVVVGLLVALGVGALCGLINGAVVAWAKVPPLIVTLGMLGAALGTAYLIADDQDIPYVPRKLSTLGFGHAFGQISWIVVIAVLTMIALGLVLALTRFGLRTYALGSNAEAARRVGVSVSRQLVAVYALCGLMAGLAGFVSLARFQTTSIGGHAGDNLVAIAAVVIGGTSLFGGRGTIFGTAIGVLIPSVLQSGFQIVGISADWQQITVGTVLVLAVYLDQLRRSTHERR
jgi:ribose transport system permease protein